MKLENESFLNQLIPNEQNIFLEISIEKSLIEKSGQIW
jgi:hypothetical protein